MNYGMDFLGGARFQKTVIQNQPRAWGFGVFAEVEGFGSAYKLIDQVAGLGVPFIRIQLQWRDKHDFNSSDLRITEARCRKLKPIIEKHKGVRWYISPLCEHNLNERQFEPFAQMVARILPGVIIVNSPNYKKGFVSKKYLNEYHHEEAPRAGGRYAFSYDGANCVDSNVELHKRNYKDAEYFMWWNSQCNGRRNLTEKTLRKDRKFWPTAKQIDSWVWLAKDKGITSCPKDIIFKSHSDQHTVPPSGKDQKPVVITPLKLAPSRLHFKATNGQTIATSTRKIPYNEKRPDGSTGKQIGWRYYFDTGWGIDHAQKAIHIQGSPVCRMFGDAKQIATVNPAFRDGSYR